MQAPRDAKGNNCYDYVLPKDIIEISEICSKYFKKCSKCSIKAQFLCKQCMVQDKPDISTCYRCGNHKCKHGDVTDISTFESKSRSKVFMELKAIICIEKSPFVSYVKQAEYIKKNDRFLKENRWYYFNSMSFQSIRKNYVAPKVTYSEEVTSLLKLSEDNIKMEIKNYNCELIKRVVSDSYIYVYHNSSKTCY